MRYAKGIMWLDDCRIPFVEDVDLHKTLPKQDGGTIYGGGKGFYRTDEITEYKSGGRFTPNLLVCDDMLNDGNVSNSTQFKGNLLDIRGNKYGVDANIKLEYGYDRGYSDKGSNSRYYDLDKWFDKIVDNL